MEVLSIQEVAWRGVPAWQLSGSRLRLVVTGIGGHFACLRQQNEELNPFWQPDWPAGTPATALADGRWGTGPEAPLLAGIVGHSLCLDRFGAPWPGETRPLHGEAGVVPWQLRPTATGATLSCHCPQAGLNLERRLSFRGPTITVETQVRHQDPAPRIIEWCEHVTLGDPFLDRAEITAATDGAWSMPGLASPAARFSSSDAAVPAAAVLAMPTASQAAPVGDIASCRLREGGFEVRRPDLGRTLAYEFTVADWPWLCIWSEHRSRWRPPWGGRQRARGMEFSTKPFPEGLPPESRRQYFHDRPTTCLVPPGEAGLVKRFRLRWQ